MGTKNFTSKRGADITSATQTVDLSTVTFDDAKALMIERIASVEEEANAKAAADAKSRELARTIGARVIGFALTGTNAGAVSDEDIEAVSAACAPTAARNEVVGVLLDAARARRALMAGKAPTIRQIASLANRSRPGVIAKLGAADFGYGDVKKYLKANATTLPGVAFKIKTA